MKYFLGLMTCLFFFSSCSNSSDAFLLKGRELMKEKKFIEAIEALNKAIEKDEKNAVAFNTRGVAYFEQNDFSNALQDYNQAIKLSPKDYKPFFNRAENYKAQGNKEEALKDYSTAILLAPQQETTLATSLADLYNNRGAIHNELGDKEKALADFTRQHFAKAGMLYMHVLSNWKTSVVD